MNYLYKNLIVLEKINSNIICYCATNYKQGNCIHKTSLDIHLKAFKKLILFSAKNSIGAKRKYKGALEKEETIDEKKNNKRMKKK